MVLKFNNYIKFKTDLLFKKLRIVFYALFACGHYYVQ